ncbi:hypothetical protein LPJ68_005938, partial [Coemansia sp. RSA 1086]
NMASNNLFSDGSDFGASASSSSTDRDTSYVLEKGKGGRKASSLASSESDGVMAAQEKDISFGEPLH